MWRCMSLVGLLASASAAWVVLGFWVAAGSERFYLLVPLVSLAVTLYLAPKGWRPVAGQIPGALGHVAGLFVFVGAYNVYLAALTLPPGPGGWLRGISVQEVLIAVYFIVAVRLLLNFPVHVLRRPLHRLFDRFVPGVADGRAGSAPARRVLRQVVPELLLVPLILPYMLGILYVHRFKLPNRVSPLDAWSRPYEDVAFESEDGLTLRGWFIPAAESPSSRCLIICHGLGANRSNFLGYVAVGDALRANVLMFDFRGHGESDGHTISFGAREERDVRAAVDYVRSARSEQAREVFGLGISMGTSALISAAARVTPPFDAVIVDSGFASAVELTDGVLANFPPFTRPWISGPGVLFASLDAGCWLSAVRPVDQIAELRCPLLIIHAEGDALIPVDHARRLYESASQPKALWITETGGHGSSLAAQAEYLQRVREVVNGTDKMTR